MLGGNSVLGDGPLWFSADTVFFIFSLSACPLPPRAWKVQHLLESLECTKKMPTCSPWRFPSYPCSLAVDSPAWCFEDFASLGIGQRGKGGVQECQLKCRKGQRDRKFRGVQRWHLVESLVPQLHEEHSSHSSTLCFVSRVLGPGGDFGFAWSCLRSAGTPIPPHHTPFSSVLLPILFLQPEIDHWLPSGPSFWFSRGSFRN